MGEYYYLDWPNAFQGFFFTSCLMLKKPCHGPLEWEWHCGIYIR